MGPVPVHTQGVNRRAALILSLAALTLILSGCASVVPRRYHGMVAGTQGAAWETVLPGRPVTDAVRRDPTLAGVGLMNPAHAETYRRDAQLGRYGDHGGERPTLRDQRYLRIPRSRDQFIYFDRTRRR